MRRPLAEKSRCLSGSRPEADPPCKRIRSLLWNCATWRGASRNSRGERSPPPPPPSGRLNGHRLIRLPISDVTYVKPMLASPLKYRYPPCRPARPAPCPGVRRGVHRARGDKNRAAALTSPSAYSTVPQAPHRVIERILVR